MGRGLDPQIRSNQRNWSPNRKRRRFRVAVAQDCLLLSQIWSSMRNYSKSFVDLQDCTCNPLIIPFLSEEEKVLLDNGDLVFLEDEDEEDKVQKQVEEKNSNMEKSLPKCSGSVTISINNSSNVHIHVNSSE